MMNATDLTTRFHAAAEDELTRRLSLVVGSMRDYHALAAHHYRADRPATVTRVLALRHPAQSAAARFQNQPPGAQTVGVLVESMPTLNSTMRENALNNRYAAWPVHARAQLIKNELRCITRVIIHPQWRGLGLAVRLVRAALQSAQTPLTEAHAAMGQVHPFFEKAGMQPYPRPPLPRDARLISALHAAGFSRHDLACLETHAPDQPSRDENVSHPQSIGMRPRIDALPDHERHWLKRELARWYRQTAVRSNRQTTSLTDHLRAAQDRLMLEPIYYLHDNRTVAFQPVD